ncbi:MAG: nucleoside triphosphate pyrophosphohydrolase [Chloroflexota bacterium]
MRVTVVGLGPGPSEWVTPAARERLHTPGGLVFARTRLFPGLDQLLAGVSWQSFDDLYETRESVSDVLAGMVERILAVGEDVVLAVPGDGVLGEAVLGAIRASGATVDVVPGLPFGIGALAAAGVEVSDGAQIVDAGALGGTGLDLTIELNPRWSAVITGVFSPRVASDVKLALGRVFPPEHAVRVVHHPGLPDARVTTVALPDLDRSNLAFDHLTHVVVPYVTGYTPNGSMHTLRAIVARLRAPEIGCPWDLEQTHRSLIPYMIEEAYEVVDAIQEDEGSGSLADELGDVLLQVALHAEIADQSNEFEWNDVVRALSGKLVRRHPHVFGDIQVGGSSDVVRNWDQLKAAERVHQPPPASALDGVPRSLPQLKRAAELSRKATKAGFAWPGRDEAIEKVHEELDEFLEARTPADQREELGDLLFILAELAWLDGIDPEEALRAANRKFTRRFEQVEAIARERGWSSLQDQPFAGLLEVWREAKVRVQTSPAC